MKKKVIFKTMLFLFIILFINVFKIMFGIENIIVGVTIITEALCLLEVNLTISPLENLVKLIGINLFTGLLAFYVCNNIFMGIALNFFVMFIIAYFFTYELRKSMVVPFGFQYLFMLYAPVYGEIFIKRILALIFGAFFIMGLQLIINKNKVSKLSQKILNKLIEDTLLKLRMLKSEEDVSNINLSIYNSINELKKIIYDARFKEFYITNYSEIIINIVHSLEKINILMDNINKSNETNKSIKVLNYFYITLKNFKDNNIVDYSFIEKMLDEENLNEVYVHEIKSLVNNINSNLYEIQMLNKKDINIIKCKDKIPKKFHKITIHKRNFKIDSTRVSYAIRLGILVSVTDFLTQYFQLSEGRWMTYTIFSIIQPYSEFCKIKSKQRVQGTLIGSVIIYIAFSLINNASGRTIIVLLSGYLNSYAENYRDSIICVTVSAIASASLIDGTVKFILVRLMFVGLGVILALVANRYLVSYNIEEEKKKLVALSKSVVNEMLLAIKDNQGHHNMKNLYLIWGFIEEKMKLIRFGKESDNEWKFIHNQKILVNSIYNYHLLINSSESSRGNIINIIKEIKILTKDRFNYVNIEKKVKKYINLLEEKNEKLLLKNILDIIYNFERITNFVVNN